MCKLKSAIILKDSVFIPDYDSHSKMLKELQIEDTRSNAERLFVRAELYPITRSRHASRLRIICTETNEDITDIYDTGVGLECTLEECEG